MNLKHSINKLKYQPDLTLDSQWIKVTKHQVLAEIGRRQELRNRATLTYPERVRLFALRTSRKLVPSQFRIAAVSMVIVMVASTGFIAQAAVPGDMLWPVKITIEKAEIVLAMDPAQEGRVHMRHVENRLKELDVISNRAHTPGQKAENISQLVRRLEKDITAAGNSLKITTEEKKDSQPQVVLSLAQDLSNKANAALKMLEDKKNELQSTSESTTPESIVPGLELETPLTTSTNTPTSSEPMVTGTTTPTTTNASKQAEEEKIEIEIDTRQIIKEVQLVNEYVSYTALASMVEIVEKTGDKRQEVSLVLSERLEEQQKRYQVVQEAVGLITDNFQIHRQQARASAKRANDALKTSQDMLQLDNLTGGLRKLIEGKDAIDYTTKILQEVSTAGGLKAKKEIRIVPQSKAKVAPKLTPVSIQALPQPPTSTESSAQE